MKAAIVKFTKPRHWDRFGDNLRLNRHGAETLAQLGGISVGPSGRPWREPERGVNLDSDGEPYYIWNYPYQAIHEGRAFAYVGVCSSKDKYFGTGAKGRAFEKVDETQIKRKAQANAIVNCVGRFVDVGNIPAEEFKAITGYDPPEKIRFEEGGYKKSVSPKGAGRGRKKRSQSADKAGGEVATARPASGGAQSDDAKAMSGEGVPSEEDLSGMEWDMLLAKYRFEFRRVEREYPDVDPQHEFFYHKNSKRVIPAEEVVEWSDTKLRRKWVAGAVFRAMKKYPPRGEESGGEEPQTGDMTQDDIDF